MRERAAGLTQETAGAGLEAVPVRGGRPRAHLHSTVSASQPGVAAVDIQDM